MSSLHDKTNSGKKYNVILIRVNVERGLALFVSVRGFAHTRFGCLGATRKFLTTQKSQLIFGCSTTWAVIPLFIFCIFTHSLDVLFDFSTKHFQSVEFLKAFCRLLLTFSMSLGRHSLNNLSSLALVQTMSEKGRGQVRRRGKWIHVQIQLVLLRLLKLIILNNKWILWWRRWIMYLWASSCH